MTGFCRYLAILLLAAGVAAESRPARAAGIAGDALRFDGGTDPVINGKDLGDFVNIPDDLSLNPQDFTVEAWVLVETGPDFFRQPFISKGVNFGAFTLSVLGDDTLAVPGSLEYVHDVDPGNFSCCGPGTDEDQVIPFGEWTHVAATYDETTNRATTYLNGQLIGSLVSTNERVTNMAALLLGRAVFVSNDEVSVFYEGLMDEVRIWNVVRTPEQIAAHFNRVVGPNTPGLVANYHFDEGFFEDNGFMFPVQEVLDSAAKPDGVDPNDGTLGADAFADADDPERVDSTAPLVGDVAECPFEETSAVCVSGTEDKIVVFYSAEPAFNVGPARCACSEQEVTVEECSPDASGPSPCFPEGNEVVSATVLDIITTDSNPRCKRVCYDADGTRVCEKICKKKKK